MKSINFSYLLLTLTSSLSAQILQFPVLDQVLNNPLTQSLTKPLTQLIPNQFIVTFKPQTNRSGLEDILGKFLNILPKSSSNSEHGLVRVFDTVIQGATIRTTSSALDMLRSLPFVESIEPDQIVRINYKSQQNAPWGLARLSQREKLTGNSYTYNYKEGAGEDVNVYVVDTGINIKHKDFEGRATWGKTIAKNATDDDGHGHGTHCAGTVGGKTYGVAKKVNLIAVKVLGDDGSGSNSDVIAGIEWVIKDSRKGKGKVISMSLGGLFSPTLDSAVNKAVEAGVTVVVAAGNDSLDACLYSPARASKAITVGATNIQDYRASFSNWGSCVDIFGPGQNILSTWKGSDSATNTISGTSMATPHIAGLVATFISQGTSGSNVKEKLNSLSSKNKIFWLTVFAVNRIGYNDYDSN